MDLVVDRLEVFEGYGLPLDQYSYQAMKSASVLGSDETLISNRLQDVDGENNLA